MNAHSVVVYLLVSLVPAALWLWWVRRQDVYEPEPVWLMLYTFFGGMMMAFPAIVLEALGTSLFLTQGDSFRYVPGAGTFGQALFFCFVLVAPIEEYLKYRTVRRSAYESKEFNEPMDGIVYMASAAIGFATLENALYMQGFGPWVLAVRMLLSTFLHVACSGIIGYHMGLGRFNPEREKLLLRRGFVLAIGLHGLYDFVALYQPVAGFFSLFALLACLWWMRERFAQKIRQALAKSPFKPRTSLMKLRSANDNGAAGETAES